MVHSQKRSSGQNKYGRYPNKKGKKDKREDRKTLVTHWSRPFPLQISGQVSVTNEKGETRSIHSADSEHDTDFDPKVLAEMSESLSKKLFPNEVYRGRPSDSVVNTSTSNRGNSESAYNLGKKKKKLSCWRRIFCCCSDGKKRRGQRGKNKAKRTKSTGTDSEVEDYDADDEESLDPRALLVLKNESPVELGEPTTEALDLPKVLSQTKSVISSPSNTSHYGK